MFDTFKLCLTVPVPRELEDLAKQLAVQVNPKNQGRPATPLEAAADWRYMWQLGSTITVRFLGGDSFLRQKVEQYAHQWEQYANLKFRFVDLGAAQLRVSFIPGGSWSRLGTQALVFSDPQLPTMNYGWFDRDTEEDEFSRVVLHEFGHALGLIHEHQHPGGDIEWDKEKAYAYYGQNGWDKEMVDDQVFQEYSAAPLRASEFDPNSIMMYPIPEGLTTNRFHVGWNRQLSDTDKSSVGKLYPFA